MKLSTLAFALFVALPMPMESISTFHNIITCSASKPCDWRKFFKDAYNYAQIKKDDNCQGYKLHCCYKYENGICTAIDGSDASGICQCVKRRGTVRNISVELELYPGRGCLNHKECKYEPKVCSWSSSCDCNIIREVSVSGRCEGGRPGKCICTTQYG